MKTGWFKVGQHWYYANGSGALAVSTTTPDGYRVNANGEWVS
ncbi:choline binding protein I [Streptococcus pneumoniae]|nr:choline binding protein I [Streptococcus pneumoniae]CKI80178.1 choline binding protein I [Streptococcus pneumoniae]